MLTGLITNIVVNNKTYNIQTEDKGRNAAEIETLIYSEGQVKAAWRISYAQLLDKENNEELIYRLMQAQHKEISDQLREGILSFDSTDIQVRQKEKSEDNLDEMIIDYLMDNLEVEEIKLKVDAALGIKKGNQVIIKVTARKHISAAPIDKATISFSLVRDSDSEPQQLYEGVTDQSGRLEASFFIPNFTGKGSLIIDVQSEWGEDHIIEEIKEGS